MYGVHHYRTLKRASEGRYWFVDGQLKKAIARILEEVAALEEESGELRKNLVGEHVRRADAEDRVDTLLKAQDAALWETRKARDEARALKEELAEARTALEAREAAYEALSLRYQEVCAALDRLQAAYSQALFKLEGIAQIVSEEATHV